MSKLHYFKSKCYGCWSIHVGYIFGVVSPCIADANHKCMIILFFGV
uniref:Uncharacterized protein n=1 Tax=Arundo donax TaxID=35708 RepID=A0A0A9CF20_ARUDO